MKGGGSAERFIPVFSLPGLVGPGGRGRSCQLARVLVRLQGIGKGSFIVCINAVGEEVEGWTW
jgi:hypothetical protein